MRSDMATAAAAAAVDALAAVEQQEHGGSVASPPSSSACEAEWPVPGPAGGAAWSVRALHFQGVSGSSELAGLLGPGAAVLHAGALPGLLAVRAAAWRAAAAWARDQQRTRTPGAEAVFCVAASKHIADSLRRHGAESNPDRVLILLTGPDGEEAAARCRALVAERAGRPAPLSTLAELADRALLNKYYKFTQAELASGVDLDESIATRIAVRDAL
eukprot:jgi/Chlat1/8421/Chrsp80S07913